MVVLVPFLLARLLLFVFLRHAFTSRPATSLMRGFLWAGDDAALARDAPKRHARGPYHGGALSLRACSRCHSSGTPSKATPPHDRCRRCEAISRGSWRSARSGWPRGPVTMQLWQKALLTVLRTPRTMAVPFPSVPACLVIPLARLHEPPRHMTGIVDARPSREDRGEALAPAGLVGRWRCSCGRRRS